MPSPSIITVVTGSATVSAKPAWNQNGEMKPTSLMAAAPSSRGKQRLYEHDDTSMLPHPHSELKLGGRLQSLLCLSSRICIRTAAPTTAMEQIPAKSTRQQFWL